MVCLPKSVQAPTCALGRSTRLESEEKGLDAGYAAGADAPESCYGHRDAAPRSRAGTGANRRMGSEPRTLGPGKREDGPGVRPRPDWGTRPGSWRSDAFMGGTYGGRFSYGVDRQKCAR